MLNYNKILLLFLYIFAIFVQCQKQFKNYDLDIVQLSPLAFTFEGQQYQSCDLEYYYLDLDVICRQMDYQRGYENYSIDHNKNTIPCGSTSEGIHLDCYRYNAIHVEQCYYVDVYECYNDCVEVVCQNYRCEEQDDQAHTCSSCIGSASSGRSPPDCECVAPQIDMFPMYEDCQDPVSDQPSQGDLELISDGEYTYLSIYNNYQYLPICGGYYFDEVAATIACKQMGYNSYISYQEVECPNTQIPYKDYYYDGEMKFHEGQYTWFDLYYCDGFEDKIEDCQRSLYQHYDCYYDYCISLKCFDLPENDGSIRTDSGIENQQSIVEILHYDFDQEESFWKPICDYSIGDELAHVMCVQQGFKTFKTYFGGQECPKNSDDGESTEFWFGRLICQGNETEVTQCRYPDTWQQIKYPCSCILLQCTNDQEKAIEGQVRISNNAIEIYHDNTWGQVCTSKSLDNIGKVVCNQLRKNMEDMVVKKIGTIIQEDAEKKQFTCPNYTKFWISDIECPSGNESNLLECNINSAWGEHSCSNDDCIFLACQESDLELNLLKYKEGDITLNEDQIIMIYHNNIWKPISDSGNEYNPRKGYYSNGIDKASAHVMCKQMGFATYKSFETQQDCGESFDGYWLGNIKCKGTEINLVECYHLPWGETLSNDANNHCVKLECSNNTCTGDNKLTLSKYPYCTCQDGYYEDGKQAHCLKCSDNCKTCIFTADNCLECSDGKAVFNVLDYDKWYENQIQKTNNGRILSEESSYDSYDDSYYYYYDDESSYYYDYYDENLNECQILIEIDCIKCDLEEEICLECNANYNPEDTCYDVYPDHHEDAPCVHIDDYCIECKGDFCYECYSDFEDYLYLSDFNCKLEQEQICIERFGDNCLSCDDESCYECKPNYDWETDCQELLPVGHYDAPCLQFNPKCIECNETSCTKCVGTLDPKYDCLVQISIQEQCIDSGCDNCNGHFCSNEEYEQDQSNQQLIVVYETQNTINLDNLSEQQLMMVKSIDKNGQLVTPTKDYVDSWGIYTCSLYCAEGYFKEKDGTCQQCSGKCKVCVDNKDNCIICQYEDNPFVGFAPNCDCLSGSKIVGNNCEKCDSGFYSFQENVNRCNLCPDHAKCLGGYEIQLEQGYWRKNQQSTDIEVCRNNKYACQGGTKTHPRLQCMEGHKGALCEVCDIEGDVWGEKYANSADYQCAQCKKVENNALKIIGINILQFISMFLSVNGTIQAVQDKIKFNSLKKLFDTHEPTPDESGVLMKILNNYLFILGVLTTFQLEVPEGVSGFNSGVSNPTKQMSHSFDCFIDSFNLGIPILYLKVFWQICMGFFQLILVFIFIKIGKKFNKIVTSFKSAFYTTIIYQFISMQPGVVTMILETIACREIAGDRYILSNTSKKCEGFEYYTYTFTIMLPIFIVLVVVIPYFFFKGLKDCYDYDLKDRNQENFLQRQLKSQYEIECNTIDKKYESVEIPKSRLDSYLHKRKIKKEQTLKLKQLKNQQKQEIKLKKKLQKEQEKQQQIDEYHQVLDRQKEIDSRKPKENYLDRSVPLGKFGYLYLEYRTQAYWWEFVKIYQRIFIAMTLSFYYDDIKVKGIIVFLTVFFYTVLSIKFKPYRLESHNRIDVISGTVTGVSLILGIFIYQNYYPEWVITAAVLLGFINLYFIVLMIARIIYQKVKTLVTKTNQKIDEKEQIEIFEKKRVERNELITKLKDAEQQKSEFENEEKLIENLQGSQKLKKELELQQKMEELEKQISEWNKQIIKIEEQLFSLEYLPKQKIEELTKEIAELPSFILQRGFEENKLQERELVQRTTQIKQQTLQQNPTIQFQELFEDEESNLSQQNKIEESNSHKAIEMQDLQDDQLKVKIDKPTIEEDNNKNNNNSNSNDNINNNNNNSINNENTGKIKNLNSTNIIQIRNSQSEPEIEDQQSNKSVQQQQQPDIFDYKKPLDNEKQDSPQNSDKPILDQTKQNTITSNNNLIKQTSILNDKKYNNKLDSQFSLLIQDEQQNFKHLNRQQKIKQRQVQQLNLIGKDEYERFKEEREQQLQVQKTDLTMKGAQIIGEKILSLFIGNTSAEDIKKAKYLRQMIKFYFKNLIVDGYYAGLIQLATIDDDKQKEIQSIPQIIQSKTQKKYSITKILKGDIKQSEQQYLYIQIIEHKKFQKWINQQILLKLGKKLAQRLKDLKYEKYTWEEQLNQDDFIQQDDKENQNTVKSSQQQYDITQYQKVIDEKVETYYNNLSDNDIEQQYAAFQLFDDNGDKTVTGEDIKIIMDKLGQNVSKKDLDNMINQVDSNENGEVDFCEFLALISSKEENILEQYVIRDIFNYFCSQSNGKLDFLDIDQILRNIFKIQESKAVLMEIIRGIDQNGPKTLDIVSFQRLIY